MTQTPAGWPPSGWPPSAPRDPRTGPSGAPGGPAGGPGGPGPHGPGRPSAVPVAAPTWAPGRFHWGDALVVGLYGLLMLLGLGGLLLMVLGLVPSDPEKMTSGDMFFMNLTSYVVLTLVVLAVAWRPLVQSLGVFRRGAWWKLALLPATWFACILVNLILLSLIGEPSQSANQAALEDMTTQAPPALMILMTVFMAPLVEEYLFRHLLIGKLSRHVNVWVCAAVSIVAFVLLHFLGTGGKFELVETVPYLTLAVAITLSYILMGRSFGYAMALHMVNNGIAVLMLYLVAPHLPDMSGEAAALVPLLGAAVL